jgi:hypothetical protein
MQMVERAVRTPTEDGGVTANLLKDTRKLWHSPKDISRDATLQASKSPPKTGGLFARRVTLGTS